jgi:hypothetical protein
MSPFRYLINYQFRRMSRDTSPGADQDRRGGGMDAIKTRLKPGCFSRINKQTAYLVGKDFSLREQK